MCCEDVLVQVEKKDLVKWTDMERAMGINTFQTYGATTAGDADSSMPGTCIRVLRCGLTVPSSLL